MNSLFLTVSHCCKVISMKLYRTLYLNKNVKETAASFYTGCFLSKSIIGISVSLCSKKRKDLEHCCIGNDNWCAEEGGNVTTSQVGMDAQHISYQRSPRSPAWMFKELHQELC